MMTPTLRTGMTTAFGNGNPWAGRFFIAMKKAMKAMKKTMKKNFEHLAMAKKTKHQRTVYVNEH
jgi:hypothetical protein